jgi:hypothetical protein
MSELLAQRRTTHGEFTDHARVVQRLKAVVTAEMARCGKLERAASETFGPIGVQYADLLSTDAVIAEALDMILHKIGRIVAGDATFKDHWVDIAGYATLVADRVGS